MKCSPAGWEAMLRVPALAGALALAAALAAPVASAEPLWTPGQSPCDGQPLVPGAEDENQVRAFVFACTYGPYVTGPFCAAAGSFAHAVVILVNVLAPGHAPPESC